MTTCDKLEALHILATRNYSTWTKKGLIKDWMIGSIDAFGLMRRTKAELIEMVVERDLAEQITEPALTQGWKNQVDYWLDLLINEMVFEDKVELIVKGLKS